MTSRRARVVKRLGVIAAAAIVVGSYFTGFAFAADDPSGPDTGSGSDNSLIKPLQDVVPGLNGSGGSPAAILPSISLPSISLPSISLPSISLPSGSSSPTGPSGVNTVVIYSPYPYPVFAGDYGHRYYGRYYDKGCGCDRYAAPTYNNSTVVNNVASTATQVSSVPKGGVDTGDGSFQ